MKGRTARLSSDQRGFAAILVAMILILILSLLTVGFAQLMRREQRSALDKQLSSQAYYAAESGVNDATAAINSGFGVAKQSCAPFTAAQISGISDVTSRAAAQQYLTNNTVGSNTSASYPCLLIDPTPPNLQYGSIDTTSSKVIELAGVDSSGASAVVKTVELSWEDANGNNTFAPGCNTFYPASGSGSTWTYTGLLRAELVPINSLNRSGLTGNAYNAFLCPDTGTPTSSDYTANKGNNGGVIVHGHCTNAVPTTTAPRHCNAQITGLGGLNQTTFFLILRSIYNPTAVTVTVYGGTGSVTTGNLLSISGAQTLVDSTGKAQDVLRRVQVRIPVHNNYNSPNGSAAIASLCKQLQLTPGGGSSGSNCTIP